MKNKFILCDCSMDLLQVQRTEDGFDFAIWSLGRGKGTLSWKERLRWCWHILKTGNPWGDSVCLSPEKTVELAKFLTEK